MKTIYILCLTLITSITMQSQNNPYPSQVHVGGTGTITVVPDQVTITVRIENTGKDAIQVKRENDKIVREVLQFLEGAQVASKNVRTDYIRLNKNYDYNSKTYNYAANQAITVVLKDLNQYEPVMNGLLNSGVNRIDNVVFGTSNMEELQAEARQKAMLDAKQKATVYAAAIDQKIGRAVTISENTLDSGPQPYTLKMSVAADASSSGPAMAPGELEIKVMIQVSFVLN